MKIEGFIYSEMMSMLRVFFAEGLTYDSFLVKTVPRFFKKDACFHGSDLTVLQLVS